MSRESAIAGVIAGLTVGLVIVGYDIIKKKKVKCTCNCTVDADAGAGEPAPTPTPAPEKETSQEETTPHKTEEGPPERHQEA